MKRHLLLLSIFALWCSGARAADIVKDTRPDNANVVVRHTGFTVS